MSTKSSISNLTVVTVMITACLGALSLPSALAQTDGQNQGRYQDQLLELSEILGQLHHLRGSCVSGEQQLWRDNMMELVRLEDPPSARKNDMVAGFNSAYESARSRFLTCNRTAGQAARALAADGERISNALARNVAR